MNPQEKSLKKLQMKSLNEILQLASARIANTGATQAIYKNSKGYGMQDAGLFPGVPYFTMKLLDDKTIGVYDRKGKEQKIAMPKRVKKETVKPDKEAPVKAETKKDKKV